MTDREELNQQAAALAGTLAGIDPAMGELTEAVNVLCENLDDWPHLAPAFAAAARPARELQRRLAALNSAMRRLCERLPDGDEHRK